MCQVFSFVIRKNLVIFDDQFPYNQMFIPVAFNSASEDSLWSFFVAANTQDLLQFYWIRFLRLKSKDL